MNNVTAIKYRDLACEELRFWLQGSASGVWEMVSITLQQRFS